MSQVTKTRATARRRPKRSPPPKHGERQVTMLRANVELLPSGELSVTGDRVNLPANKGRALVRAGAAEFVDAEGDAA